MKPFVSLTALSLLLAGCWTFNETVYPTVRTTAANANAKTVRLTGFEARMTEWQAVHGYRTIFVPGCYGYRPCDYGYGGFTTVPAVDYVPQKFSTNRFLLKAQDLFEKAGFVLAPTDPDYAVDVHFDGPLASSDDDFRRLGWNLCTLFFCDRGTARWSAKLRVREAKTGKLLFHRDYDQSYETDVFGLIPVFGAASCAATDSARMQEWCLAALTDRVCADATAFVAAGK